MAPKLPVIRLLANHCVKHLNDDIDNLNGMSAAGPDVISF